MLQICNEVLFQIFDYLTASDKEICIRVYEQLLFNKYFQEYKSRRNQVHRLRISLYGNASHVNGILALPEQFQHLREFVYRHNKDDRNESDISKIVIDERVAQHWQGITTFHIDDKYLVSSKLLQYGGFCNLVELGVRFGGSERSELKCNALIQYLSNAPKLKILNLDHGKMSIGHFYQLHCNAQQLEVLSFHDMDLASRDVNKQERLIASSNTLTELRLLQCSQEFNESMLGRTEYSNLKILQVHISEIHDEKYGEDQLIEFVSHCQYLQNYDVSIYPITPAIVKAMDASGIKLKELTILSLYDMNPLNQVGCLRASNQICSILKMTIDYSYYQKYKKIQFRKLFNHLKGFPNLKHLNMVVISDNHFPSLPFDVLLTKCRNLETLELKYWRIQIGFKLFNRSVIIPRRKFTTKLKALVLHEVIDSDNSIKFISTTCPGLSKLTIFPKYNGYFPNIHFPNHNFASIKVDRPDRSIYHSNAYYYQVTDEKGTKWYKMLNGIQEKTFEEFPTISEKNRMFSLTYKNCTTLQLGDTYI
ncbi:hypothetical protein [Parasitella parasitica]|uniref:F-box domain-containing protein n=1 Tax=Parasitella parasitica TaxID=35722 RepID=A0A0B7N3H8_9FUNG|nr:hypothetical protein [Parasitella parasitica]